MSTWSNSHRTDICTQHTVHLDKCIVYKLQRTCTHLCNIILCCGTYLAYRNKIWHTTFKCYISTKCFYYGHRFYFQFQFHFTTRFIIAPIYKDNTTTLDFFCTVKMLQPILNVLNSKRITLASTSPRRKLLLENVVRDFSHYKNITSHDLQPVHCTVKKLRKINTQTCLLQQYT